MTDSRARINGKSREPNSNTEQLSKRQISKGC